MIGSLPLFHRIKGLRVVVVSEGVMGEAKTRLVERAGGIPCSEAEAHHAHLAFVALEDDREAEAVALRLKRRGLLVNVADRPELCDFTTPSILDREPVLVAVSTSGASAGLAKHLRLRLERLLPPSLGSLAAALRDARDAMRGAWPDGDARRGAVDRALSEGGVLDPLGGADGDDVAQWIAAAGTGVTPAEIIEITLHSDDPDDLTLKQARLLGTCDTLLHDPAIPRAILDRSRADAERRTLPNDPPGHGLTVILRRALD
ncbi:NAD(P)-dependent oxidoreductase [Qipengyuania sp. DSG2-2]|uniref:precorrin-2 dehydrogenase/sirohydrochlorin ferrochelatase family protein n=1 Tax=Qipengyuania sp. DGS2-2 TaxID=3349631 RepID=UPI0036D320BA